MASTSITKDTESYRRGVIFGLTMAEVLLLLVFCILLFLKIINDRLLEKEKQYQQARDEVLQKDLLIAAKDNELSAKETEISKLILQNKKLVAEKTKLDERILTLSTYITNQPKTSEPSPFLRKITESAAILEATNSSKAEQFLQELSENPSILNDIQLSTVEEWDELTTIAQYAVTEEQFNQLSNLSELNELAKRAVPPDVYEELSTLSQLETENLLENIEVASSLSADEFQELTSGSDTETFLRAEKANLAKQVSMSDLQKLVDGELVPAGDKWPPIISLSEAKDYSFKVGSASLASEFEAAIKGDIASKILETLKQYDADIVEVIGHTDLQPMAQSRNTNLDKNSTNFLSKDSKIELMAKDNAGLGYARALSVAKQLMNLPQFDGYKILPYSAAQMISPDETINREESTVSPKELRRIEIRVRRSNEKN